jgi:hypothetical protein
MRVWKGALFWLDRGILRASTVAEHPEIPDRFAPAVRWVLAFVLVGVFALGASDSFRDKTFIAAGIYVVATLITFVAAVKWRQIGRFASEKGSLVLTIGVILGSIAAIFTAGMFVGRRVLLTPAAIGDIVWNLEQTSQGAGYFLGMTRLNNDEIRVLGFQAHGKSNSSKPIEHFTGYMRSELTNEQIPIYLMGQDPLEATQKVCLVPGWIPTLPQETFGIPPFADFDIATFDKPLAAAGKDGMTLTKFMNDFVPFTVVLEYDGTRYERRFTQEEVQIQVTLFQRSLNPQNTPRVLRRSTAKPATLPNFQTLVPAAPPQTAPGLASPIPPTGLPKLQSDAPER